MDYKEKVIALLNSQELSKEQKEKLENIFPELKENKSERVRKGLIKTISSLLDNTILYHTDITKEEALAWLEKQKLTDEEIIFRPIAGTDIRIAAKQALEKIDIGKKVVLAFNGAYIPVNGKTVGEIDSEYDAWLEKQKEKDLCINCINDKGCITCENGNMKETKATSKIKTLDADKVIAWLVANICDFEYYVKLFKKDFGLC